MTKEMREKVPEPKTDRCEGHTERMQRVFMRKMGL